MKIDSQEVRNYLEKALKANLTELIETQRDLRWEGGWVDINDELDRSFAPKIRDVLNTITGHIREQFELSEIPNWRYKNLYDLKAHLVWMENYLSNFKNDLSDHFSKYQKRAQKNHRYIEEPPTPMITAMSLIDTYLTVIKTALKLKDLHDLESSSTTNAIQNATPITQSTPNINLDQLINILLKFDVIAKGVNHKRRLGKHPYLFEDEYDVQDFLYGLLYLSYGDVRKEENIQSFGVIKSRCDLLLANEKILIEIKSTLKKNESDIYLELNADASVYLNSSVCEHLVYFIYDPNRQIHNRDQFNELKKISVNGKSVNFIIFSP